MSQLISIVTIINFEVWKSVFQQSNCDCVISLSEALRVSIHKQGLLGVVSEDPATTQTVQRESRFVQTALELKHKPM